MPLSTSRTLQWLVGVQIVDTYTSFIVIKKSIIAPVFFPDLFCSLMQT
jgi:hypothetical protein